MKTLGFLLAFAVAVWSLSAGWTAWRAAWALPTTAAMVWTALYAALFLAAFLYLGFWLYAADRAAGRVRRRIGLYERFLREK